jgi:hypothetical protein
MKRAQDVRSRSALLAAALAFASAATSLYWTLGGTWLLDTVGGAIEDLARERSAGALALGGATVALKLAAGLLALALARGAGPRRAVGTACAAAAAVLLLWGGANVAVGGLVLADVVAPGSQVDERALRWHVFLWDAWFVLWGAALAIAVAAARRGG